MNGDRPWRVGRHVFRTIYDVHDDLIGVMDTPEFAMLMVASVNLVHQMKDRAAEETKK